MKNRFRSKSTRDSSTDKRMKFPLFVTVFLFGCILHGIHHADLAGAQNGSSDPNSLQNDGNENPANGQAEALYTDAANFQKGGAYPIAIESWNTFLKKHPKHPLFSSAAYYLGVCHMQKAMPDFRKAEEAFETTLTDKTFQLRNETLTNLAWCLYQRGISTSEVDKELLGKSLEYLSQVLDGQPSPNQQGQVFFYSGEVSYRLGANDQAIKFFNQFLESQTQSSPLWFDTLYGKGVAQEETQQNMDAIQTYQQILSQCEDKLLVSDVRIRVGDLYILESNFQEAVQQFRLASVSSQLPADRAYALFREAFSLVQLDQFETAAAKYQELLKLYPDSDFAGPSQLANAQSLYRGGKMNLAELEFAKICEGNDRIAATESTHWVARIKISQSRFQEALTFIAEQRQRGFDGSFSLSIEMDKAEALSASKKTADRIAAKELFSLIYRQHPTHRLAAEALFNASVLSFQLNEFEEALFYADDFLSKFDREILGNELRYIKAECQKSLGKSDAASASFTSLFQVTPKDNANRGKWLLRASSHWNLSNAPEQTVAMLSSGEESFGDPIEEAEAQLLLGQAYLQLAAPEKAVECLRRITIPKNDWTKSLELKFTLGQALRDEGEIDEAVDCWEQLITDNESSEYSNQARYQLANISQDQGKYQLATARYKEIIESTKSSNLRAYAHYGLGWSLIRLEEYQQAVDALTSAVESMEPAILFDALIARGTAYRRLSQADLAKNDLERCLPLARSVQQKGDSRYELSLVHLTLNDREKAIKILNEIIDSIPEYGDLENVLHELAWAYKDNMQTQLAVTTFNRQLERFPNSNLASLAAYYVGQQMYTDREYDLAIEKFDIAMRNSQDSDLIEKSIYRIAWSYFNQEKHSEAEQWFQRQADKFPNGSLHFDSLMMIGECRYQKEEFESALDAFTRSRNIVREKNFSSETLPDPSERQVCEIIFLHGGQSSAQLERWQDALQWYRELRDRFPATSYLAEVFYESGFANKQLGNNQPALELLKEVAENYRNETAARARFMMGEILFSDGELALAVPEFQRVMYGFGAESATEPIKNWQAKSGFEAGRCSELIITKSKTANAKEQAKTIAIQFYRYVFEKHPNHPLASKAKEKIEVLQVD